MVFPFVSSCAAFAMNSVVTGCQAYKDDGGALVLLKSRCGTVPCESDENWHGRWMAQSDYCSQRLSGDLGTLSRGVDLAVLYCIPHSCLSHGPRKCFSNAFL